MIDTHWRRVANTISVCGGDAALCQITLTTYLHGDIRCVCLAYRASCL